MGERHRRPVRCMQDAGPNIQVAQLLAGSWTHQRTRSFPSGIRKKQTISKLNSNRFTCRHIEMSNVAEHITFIQIAIFFALCLRQISVIHFKQP